jgi:hypothetical protein
MLRQNGASFRKKMFEDAMTFNFVQEEKSKKVAENSRKFANCSEITSLTVCATQGNFLI